VNERQRKILQDLWRERFIEAGAYWHHNGDPEREHALLTSGKHSDGFFNASKVIDKPWLLNSAMQDLASLLQEVAILPKTENLWVVGSALGAIDISFALGLFWNCHRGFTEQAEVSGAKAMSLKRFDIPKGCRVQVVEDVMTTGGTTIQTIVALEHAGLEVLPNVGVLLNRSGSNELGTYHKVVALVNQPMSNWEADECPLCKAGSKALRPKQNWATLNKK